MMQHIMLDHETLGTTADAVIMSIGAVKFDIETGKMDDAAFYASVSIESNLELGRKIDESTLLWWLKQSPEAQKVFHEPKQTLSSALEDFVDWVDHPKYIMWSNGADFDLPQILHALRSVGLEAPWEFWNHRCFRTLKGLPAAKGLKSPPAQHNALQDAVDQAAHAAKIWALLKEPA